MSRTILKNAGVLFIAELVNKGLSFFLIVAIARYLGEAGLGKYSFAFALAGLFAIGADLGLTTYLTREIARDKKKASELISNMLGIKLVLAAVTTVTPMIVIHFIEKSPEVQVSVYLAAAATGILNLTTVFNTIFNAFEKLEHVAIANLVERILTVGLGILLMTKGLGIIGLVFAYLISYFAVFIYLLMTSLRQVKFGIRLDYQTSKKLIINSMPFWFTSLFITIYFRIDTVILQMMTDYVQVGLYNAAFKALDSLYFVPYAIITAVFPAMSRLHATDHKMLQAVYQKAFYYLMLLALPIGIGTTLLAARIIPLIYGEQFISATLALQILIWAEVIIFVSSLTGYLLNAVNKQTTFTYTTAIAAAFKIILNIILIPKIGYIGAAISTVATELVVFTILYYFAFKEGYSANLKAKFTKPILACIIMGAAIILLWNLNIILLIGLAGIIYFAAILAMKGIEKEETDLIKGILRR